MAIQKSSAKDIQTIIGNGFAIYIDGLTGILMCKDTNGVTKPLEEMITSGEVTIVNNLNSTSATSALSANQGRLLDEKKVDKVEDSSLVPNTEIAKIPHGNRDDLNKVSGTNTGDQNLDINRIIFVATDGDDTTGDGSFSKPFLTINKGLIASVNLTPTSVNQVIVKVGVGSYVENNSVEPIIIPDYVSLIGDGLKLSVKVTGTTSTEYLFTNNGIGKGLISNLTIHDINGAGGGGIIWTGGASNRCAFIHFDTCRTGLKIDGAGVQGVCSSISTIGCDVGISAYNGSKLVVYVLNINTGNRGLYVSGVGSQISPSTYTIDGAGTGIWATSSGEVHAIGGEIDNCGTSVYFASNSTIYLDATHIHNSTTNDVSFASSGTLYVQDVMMNDLKINGTGTIYGMYLSLNDNRMKGILYMVVNNISSNSTILNYSINHVNTSGGEVIITLPLATLSGVKLDIKKISLDSNILRILPQGASEIDGSVELLITTQYDSVTLYNDGINWFLN
jgi:hypothetical protein